VYRHILLPRWASGDWIEPLVQIHDDLVLESATFGDVQMVSHPDNPKKRVALVQDDALNREMVHAMCTVPAHWLSVPIETSGDVGFNWGEMAEIRKAA